jgi:hypothetical protein
MDKIIPIRAVFVATKNSLSAASGGVQIYTRELLEALRLGGFFLSVVEYESDWRVGTRVRRKLCPRPYADRVPPEVINRVVEQQQQTHSSWILLNGVDLAPTAEKLRLLIPASSASLALFSHGLESVDYLHEARSEAKLQTNLAVLKLGRQLAAECLQRAHLDQVFVMAPFEAEIERWLGSKRVTVVPRTVAPGSRLHWQPNVDRVGCVGTFDHPPNAEGLALFLAEFDKIAPPTSRFRLVGGPRGPTEALVGRFPCVDYLGPLDEAALRAEASTWSCFVHPVFCFARGASTKISIALSWHVPIATTAAGIRGYEWFSDAVHGAESPRELADESLRLMEPSAGLAAVRDMEVAIRSAPTIVEVGALIRAQLAR